MIRFTLGALWPMGAWGPRRDLMAKRTICLLTKMNSSTNTLKTKRDVSVTDAANTQLELPDQTWLCYLPGSRKP